MKRLITLGVIAPGLSLAIAAPANAGCKDEKQIVLENGVAEVRIVRVCSGGDTAATSSATDSDPHELTMLEWTCLRIAENLGEDPQDYCDFGADDASTQAVTPAVAAAALARIDLPPSELIIQPPNGRTLVNLETNFYTDAQPFTRTVTLLGQRVELDITPSSFGWRFGDGESMSTASPGSAYPDLEVTHSYLRKGRVAPSVDTTYTARFRVNGGPWQPVPGSVTIPGPTVGLQVVTARPQLVG